MELQKLVAAILGFNLNDQSRPYDFKKFTELVRKLLILLISENKQKEFSLLFEKLEMKWYIRVIKESAEQLALLVPGKITAGILLCVWRQLPYRHVKGTLEDVLIKCGAYVLLEKRLSDEASEAMTEALHSVTEFKNRLKKI